VEAIAIFGICNNNRKFFLFDEWLNMIRSEEETHVALSDDDGFAGEETEGIKVWMKSCLNAVVKEGKYIVKALNCTTCGSDFILPGFEDYNIKTGAGMTDSVAAMVPYLRETKEQFILISTGIWCTFINPFNTGPLTAEQQYYDAMDYLSTDKKQVVTSRLKLGYIHDRNVERLNDHYGVPDELYKTIKNRSKTLGRMLASKRGRVFFRHGVPSGYVDNEVNLSHYLAFADAYHQLIFDLVDVCMESIRLILSPDDKTEIAYITGVFSGNDSFTHTLAARLHHKRVFTSDLSNASALGAAMTVYESAFGKEIPAVYLGLRAVLNG